MRSRLPYVPAVLRVVALLLVLVAASGQGAEARKGERRSQTGAKTPPEYGRYEADPVGSKAPRVVYGKAGLPVLAPHFLPEDEARRNFFHPRHAGPFHSAEDPLLNSRVIADWFFGTASFRSARVETELRELPDGRLVGATHVQGERPGRLDVERETRYFVASPGRRSVKEVSEHRFSRLARLAGRLVPGHALERRAGESLALALARYFVGEAQAERVAQARPIVVEGAWGPQGQVSLRLDDLSHGEHLPAGTLALELYRLRGGGHVGRMNEVYFTVSPSGKELKPLRGASEYYDLRAEAQGYRLVDDGTGHSQRVQDRRAWRWKGRKREVRRQDSTARPPGRRDGAAEAALARIPLGTLQGLAVGQTFRLHNPVSGRRERATVTGLWPDPHGGAATVRLRFSHGEETVAADHLHMLGQPAAVRRARFERQRRQVAQAIRVHLGVRADHVLIKVLPGADRLTGGLTPDGRLAESRDRRAVRRPYLQRYLDGSFEEAMDRAAGSDATLSAGELWERLRGGFVGFAGVGRAGRTSSAFEGTEREAVLSDHFSAYQVTTHLHEVLHALSDSFIRQTYAVTSGSGDPARDKALREGYRRLMEGATEYFAQEVALARFGIRRPANHTYNPYVEFVRAMSHRLGSASLAPIFFGQGEGLVSQLREIVGARGRGNLDAAVIALGSDQLEAAKRALGPTPMGDGTFSRTPWHPRVPRPQNAPSLLAP